jgi:hypothetical protein
MADIDPYAQLAGTMRTPRSPTLVDQVAEAQRVAESIARANPLYNARIDGGLMIWRGNYAGAGGIADSLLWIGQFSPIDGSKGVGQRGFALTRDDPEHGWAFYMFDPQGESRSSTDPLRQRVFIRDADNRQILTEARGGGTAFPVGQIPLYSSNLYFQATRTDSGTGMKSVPLPPGTVQGGLNNYFKGYGPMVGHRLRFYGYCWSSGSATFQVRFRAAFGDNQPDYVSGFLTWSAGQSQNFLWDVDFAGQDKVGRIVAITVEAQVVSGTAEWCTIFPQQCYSYGDS